MRTVGSGFSHEDLKKIRARLEPARRPSPPLAAPASKGTVWVEPELVVEVRYKEWTEGGHLRHPVFLRVRDDKTVEECFRPGEEGSRCRGAACCAPTKARARIGPKGCFLHHLHKVFWPDEGITKGDLVDYYRTENRFQPFSQDLSLVRPEPPAGGCNRIFSAADLADF